MNDNIAAPVEAEDQTTTQAEHTEDDGTLSPEQLEGLLAHADDAEVSDSEGSEDSQVDDPNAKTDANAGPDLESLTEEQLEQLAEQMNSRGASRIAQLIRERKQLEQQIETARSNENPLEGESKPESNPFHEIASTEALQAKYAEVSELVEWAEDLLDDNDDEHRESVIHVEDEKEYTKGEIRKMLRNARKAKNSHLPSRLRDLQARDTVTAERQQARQLAEEEFAWMKDPDSPILQRYESVLNHPALEALKESMPEIPLVIAHAANSIHESEQRKAGKQPTRTVARKAAPTRLRPPGNPMDGNAAPAKQGSKPAAALTDLYKEFEATGDHNLLSDILTLESQQ